MSGNGAADTLSYAWMSNGITVGTGTTYTVQENAEGGRITLTVTDTAATVTPPQQPRPPLRWRMRRRASA